MKKVVILSIVFCSVLYSCIIEPEPALTAYYTMFNQSSQNIKIRVPDCKINPYEPYEPFDVTFHIPKGQKFEYMIIFGELFFPFGLADTAFIIFNDSDTILYTFQNTSSYNILRTENYQERVEEKKRRTIIDYYYTYIFTEADYQHAVNNKK